MMQSLKSNTFNKGLSSNFRADFDVAEDFSVSNSKIVTELGKPKMVVRTSFGLIGSVDFPKTSFDNLRSDAKVKIFNNEGFDIFPKSELTILKELEEIM